MKNKVLIALSLASVLSVAAPAVSAFAAEAAVESGVQAPAEDGTDAANAKKPAGAKRGGKRGAGSTTDGTVNGTTDGTTGGTTDGARRGGCGRGKHGMKEEVAEPENAIGKDAAKEKALADAGTTADAAGKVHARLTTLEDGTVVYKVRFTVDSQKYSYKIEALSGSIVDKSTEAVTEDEADGMAKKGHGHGKKEEVAEPENAIGKDAAKEKALADAGITAETAGKVRARLTTLEDGTVVYKVRFTVDSQKYSYKIEAVSGNIVDKSTEAVTEEEADGTAKKGHGHGGRGGATKETPENAVETTAV